VSGSALRTILAPIAAATAGAIVGALLTLSTQSAGFVPKDAGPRIDRTADPTVPEISTGTVTRRTFLAWTPGGLPSGFESGLRRLPGVRHAVAVVSDTAWMTRSLSADGAVVDRAPRPYAIPIETNAVDPKSYSPFLPPAQRHDIVSALAGGKGVLGASSALLRGLRPGGVMEFGRRRVEVAAVLPDELVGAGELFVSRETAGRLGVSRERYALVQPRPIPSIHRFTHAVERTLPAGVTVQVRGPGDPTPYLRHADAVLPPVAIKLVFGEFAARPDGGFLDVDPAWVRENIDTRHMPLLGNITCHVGLFPQLRGAMAELKRRGLSDLVRTQHGCYVPKFVLNSPTGTISHHAWGIGFDINLAGNEFGERPHQPRILVRILRKWGFTWGGGFILPDGNHFEYHNAAKARLLR
jgi:D-alanyl-D-alanine carboxypeptidase-like protein